MAERLDLGVSDVVEGIGHRGRWVLLVPVESKKKSMRGNILVLEMGL
jgi:hypothetical protein